MSNTYYASDLIYALNEIVTQVGFIRQGIVKDEGTVRFIITGAGPSNQVVVRGRIFNQSTWDDLVTFTGNVNELVQVFTYDEIEVVCTVFSAQNGYDFRLVASSFDSSKITVVTPDGTIDNFNTLTLTSSDDTILFDTDLSTGTIDLSASAASAAITKKIIEFTTADWTLSGDEYLLTVTAATHTKGINPEVVVLENTGTEFAEVILYKAINASGDLLLAVSAIPDNRFAGKLIIT